MARKRKLKRKIRGLEATVEVLKARMAQLQAQVTEEHARANELHGERHRLREELRTQASDAQHKGYTITRLEREVAALTADRDAWKKSYEDATGRSAM